MSKKNKDNNNENIDRREYRRKRRVRSQIISYVSLVLIIAAIAVGAVFGIQKVRSVMDEKKATAEAARLAEEKASEEAAAAEAAAAEAAAAEEETTEEEEYTEEDLLEEVVQTCIADMTLEEKVAGLFVVTPEQITGVDKVVKAGDGTKEALEKYPVGGLIYFADNITSEDQITEMLANTVSYSKFPLFLCVDEELGSVNRLRKSLKLSDIDSASAIGKAGDANAAYENYKTIGEYLVKYGFNVDLAPVADILLDESNTAIGDRSFGSDTETVSTMMASSVKGLEEAGVTSCLKHFPGQGAANGDTHEGLASTSRTADEIKNNEIKPFLSGVEAGAQMIMVGHFTAPELTGDSTTPCSLSKQVMTDLLRGEYGYNGVIITDSLRMSAVSEYYDSDDAAVKALKAGADMILMPEDFEAAYNGVVAAVKDGTISEERINDSLARVYRIKYKSTVE